MNNVVHLTPVTRLRLRIRRASRNQKGLAKSGTERPASSRLAELANDSLLDEPDVILYVGASGEWTQCHQCFREIDPGQTCQQDLTNTLTWCANCWPIRGE